MKDDAARAFDVIVWGATSFTGELVAEHLQRQHGGNGGLRWAIAGRNLAKLESVRARLGAGAKGLPILLADSHDAASLDALVVQTRVVCSTVGPYAKYGSDLVATCVKHGTDYCDLAGEPQWIRSMIDQHHDAARQSGARIVTSCGFDSVPSDMGVYFLQQQSRARFSAPCAHVKLRLKAMSGGASGGTIASMFSLLEEAKNDPAVRALLEHPYSLNPRTAMTGPDRPDLHAAAFDPDFNSWIAPFVMAGINTRIVRRSNALMGHSYGEGFSYDEAVLCGPGVAGRLKASTSAVALAGFTLGGAFRPTRALMQKVLPKPGEGPSPEARESGYFDLQLWGQTTTGAVLRAQVTGDADPGYGSTSKMLGECAACLAQDRPISAGGGVVTPASAIADQLLPRLVNNAGLTFQILDDAQPASSSAHRGAQEA